MPSTRTVVVLCGEDICLEGSENNFTVPNFSDNIKVKLFRSPEAGGVPYSCCKSTRDTGNNLNNLFCGYKARVDPSTNITGQYLRANIHKEGCAEVISTFLMRNAAYIGIVLFVVFFAQMLSTIMSCVLRDQIMSQFNKWYAVDNICVRRYEE